MGTFDAPENIGSSAEQFPIEAVTPEGGEDEATYPDTSLPVDDTDLRDDGAVLPEEVGSPQGEEVEAAVPESTQSSAEDTAGDAKAAKETPEDADEEDEPDTPAVTPSRKGRGRAKRDESNEDTRRPARAEADEEEPGIEVQETITPIGLLRPVVYRRDPEGGWTARPAGEISRATARALKVSHDEQPVDQKAADEQASGDTKDGKKETEKGGRDVAAETEKAVGGAALAAAENAGDPAKESATAKPEGPTAPKQETAEAPASPATDRAEGDAAATRNEESGEATTSPVDAATQGENAETIPTASRYTFAPTIPPAERARMAAGLEAAGAEVIPTLTHEGRLPAELPHSETTAAVVAGTGEAVTAYVARFGVEAAARVARVRVYTPEQWAGVADALNALQPQSEGARTPVIYVPTGDVLIQEQPEPADTARLALAGQIRAVSAHRVSGRPPVALRLQDGEVVEIGGEDDVQTPRITQRGYADVGGQVGLHVRVDDLVSTIAADEVVATTWQEQPALQGHTPSANIEGDPGTRVVGGQIVGWMAGDVAREQGVSREAAERQVRHDLIQGFLEGDRTALEARLRASFGSEGADAVAHWGTPGGHTDDQLFATLLRLRNAGVHLSTQDAVPDAGGTGEGSAPPVAASGPDPAANTDPSQANTSQTGGQQEGYRYRPGQVPASEVTIPEPEHKEGEVGRAYFPEGPARVPVSDGHVDLRNTLIPPAEETGDDGDAISGVLFGPGEDVTDRLLAGENQNLGALVPTTEGQPQQYTREEREWLKAVASEVGLRPGEIRRMSVSDLHRAVAETINDRLAGAVGRGSNRLVKTRQVTAGGGTAPKVTREIVPGIFLDMREVDEILREQLRVEFPAGPAGDYIRERLVRRIGNIVRNRVGTNRPETDAQASQVRPSPRAQRRQARARARQNQARARRYGVALRLSLDRTTTGTYGRVGGGQESRAWKMRGEGPAPRVLGYTRPPRQMSPREKARWQRFQERHVYNRGYVVNDLAAARVPRAIRAQREAEAEARRALQENRNSNDPVVRAQAERLLQASGQRRPVRLRGESRRSYNRRLRNHQAGVRPAAGRRANRAANYYARHRYYR